ncbi:aminoglycoside phosphotransferase family protein [Hyphomicrobium sp.]|uniref:aminoglycoside phosphotransferase family protein n=1 Tax=Hyphomicrobium sp. TaxID=82 RepID=UPI0025B96D5F|nr:aminoglycoside phosphotransferase family protein [Hyphomicrobium sp.]MCC7250247.1 APH(6) family putative aminoglycoside O-phosphotransferase [Hyphomicrobium sp.]
MFDAILARWGLAPDGAPIVTPRAGLLPVRRGGGPAMLKVATEPEEMRGGVLMSWWDGEGAARVLAMDGPALLLERAQGRQSLTELARTGRDDEATRILCTVIAKLHAPREKPLPDGLVPLEAWFEALAPAAAAFGGILTRCAAAARDLLGEQRNIGVLHGDIHHDNVLDFGARGWLAIDPKSLVGERGFDYANLFCNPDMDDPSQPVAVLPERFRRRLDIVVDAAGLERARLLKWILAYTGLSAAWCLNDGQSAEVDLRVAELALAEADR